MEKEIQSLRLQLEQIDQENKRLRDLLVNMSKDNSVVKSTYVQYNYSYNAAIDMIEETCETSSRFNKSLNYGQ